jgi:hypothetical protein
LFRSAGLLSWRRMDLFQMDDNARLFISPAIES